MKRNDGREPHELRLIQVTRDYVKNATGSCLFEMGHTRVICAASVENQVPKWLTGQGKGWVSAEYSMLPYATHERKAREGVNGKISGRTHEIQRLVGRSLRGVIDLNALGERTIWLDCDVIQADGGTRTASINGCYVALILAIQKLMKTQKLATNPVREAVAAISVGIYENVPLLDICYEEDSKASVDMNIVMTEGGKYIEIQGTAEHHPFSAQEMEGMLSLASTGLKKIFQIQKEQLDYAS